MMPWRFPQSGPVWGLDTIEAVTEQKAFEIARTVADEKSGATYQWIARYIARDKRRLKSPDKRGGDYMGCWTLSRSELADLLGAGLAVLPVQWGPPSRANLGGAQDGHIAGIRAAEYAEWLGIPKGVHLWCDVEGQVAMRSGPSGCREYIEAWAVAVLSHSYLAGLYVGPGVPLNGRQLYSLRGISSYWASATDVFTPRPRGYSIEQDLMTEVCGVKCDTDTIRADRFGDSPVLVLGTDDAVNASVEKAA